jgi:hypothetical protein
MFVYVLSEHKLRIVIIIISYGLLPIFLMEERRITLDESDKHEER